MSERFAGRYLFVAGLHRSGTSLLTRLIAQHPEIAAITQSPAPENEGCYLQGAVPHTALHGRPGHYATDPEQHLVEGCAYDTLETARRLEADWARWFDPGGTWRVEKSPVNLVRTRLYQQLFPTAQFVFILRHPASLAAAHAKWVERSHHALVDYVLAGYERALADLPYLHAALVLRYEDLVAAPERALAAIDSFLDLAPHPRTFDLRDGNMDYAESPELTDLRKDRAAAFGYGDAREILPMPVAIRHPFREVRERTEQLLR